MSAAETHDNVHDLIDRGDPIHQQWARFRDRFAEAMDGALYAIEDLEAKVLSRRAILFAGKGSAIVGETVEYDAGVRAMQLLWACGEVDELIGLLPGIEALARVQGCDRMVVEGPRAWQRILRGVGYEFFSVTLTKGL